ncbi:hypothetical protein [Salinarimonas soli]|uniref:Uncharacterized protein n=1 Tax=Salinarimonas soli TaxID=1638099 RepID=A0A5B2VF28_9HYPH|nr:hypothetical protein [Salinarimonas soli]KAA2237721.1 hypothetical protein F0L46_08565 [Salinarimonas soli]
MPGTNDIGLRMARGRGQPSPAPEPRDEPPARPVHIPPARISLAPCPFGRGPMSYDPVKGETFAAGEVVSTRARS